jgi:DNA repair protein RecO (recombination protein O)
MTMFDTLAICLRSTPYREADRIVTLYSAAHGELRAIAKGVKKPPGKLAGVCEPLTLNHVYLVRGKSLHTVTGYQRMESFRTLRGSLERMAAGSACTDVVRLLGRENDPDSHAVYNLLAETLKALDIDDGQHWIASSLRFHVGLLDLSGYLPRFDRCVVCASPLDGDRAGHYPFFLELGGLACEGCQSMVTGSRRVNVSTATLHLLEAPDNATLYDYAFRAHRFLGWYWGVRMEQDLKSFDFLLQMIATAHGEGSAADVGTAERV